jgi:hypothetical protein
VILTVCDHFEPFHDTDLAGARTAMDSWEERLPLLAEKYRDASGTGFKHTFFYPVEQYHEEIVGRLASLCRKTGSEVEVHLHHQHDTAEGLEDKLVRGIADLQQHGCLGADPSGQTRFGFIHGNWALDNSGHHDGRCCGVSNELGILRRLGCYADFTFPSAPDGSQPSTINSIYYAKDTPEPKSHDHGVAAANGVTNGLGDMQDHLLLIQGPLGFNWQRRKWGLIPKIENAEVSGANPWSAQRWPLWLELAPAVAGGPPWIFVKLHTHGGIRRNYQTLLSSAAEAFHSALTGTGKIPGSEGSRSTFRYATAREMANMVHAAEDGCTGDPATYRDYKITRPPGLTRAGG